MAVENGIRIIGYGIIAAIASLGYWFLHSHFLFLALVLLLAGPIVSLVCGYYIARKVSVEVVSMVSGHSVCGDETYFDVVLKNPTIFTSLDVKIFVAVENSFMGTGGKKTFAVPLYAKKGYKLTLPLVVDYPGLLSVSVSEIKIKDLTGFFFFKKKVEASCELPILPKRVAAEEFQASEYSSGMLESEESSKRGNDFSDVQGIREYIPGDKLMSIHWKLSAKRDILMVKDRVSMSDQQLAFLLELANPDPVVFSELLTTAYSAILEFLENQTSVRFLYWSMTRFEYENMRLDYAEDLVEAFTKMFYEKTYESIEEGGSHMAYVYPEYHAYVYASLQSGTPSLVVRDNQ